MQVLAYRKHLTKHCIPLVYSHPCHLTITPYLRPCHPPLSLYPSQAEVFIDLGCAGSSLLYWLFSGCGKWWLLFVVVHGHLTAVTSLAAEPKL